MKKILIATFGLAVFVACGAKTSLSGEHYADFVDTSVGVIDKNSNCVVGPMLPYGSINPSPQSQNGSSDGYKPTEPIRGFGQLHVSGTGWPTYGNFLLSAQTGLTTDLLGHDSPHSGDVTKAYYFATSLDRYGIKAEVTPSHYSAIYRFTYPESEVSSLVFDAVQTIAGDIFPPAQKIVHASEAVIDAASGTVRMMLNMTGGWPEDPHTIYCVAKFDKSTLLEYGCWKDSVRFAGQESISVCEGANEHIGVYCSFKTSEGERVNVKLATSFTGYEKAEELMGREIPGWNFERTFRKARKAWDEKLALIKIDTVSDDDRTIFYSGLFRFFTFAHDRSQDRAEGQSTPFWDDNYAYWDTFRTVYPLLLLLDKDAYADNIKAVINRFGERGGIWDAFVAGTDRKADQGGNNIDCILADAFVKGVEDVDWEKAYAIVKHNADSMRVGMTQDDDNGAHLLYKELGWIPYCRLSVSQTLEFAYNDFCAYQMAHGLGYEEDATRYLERSGRWEYLWNPSLESEGYKGFVDARRADGEFVGIDPAKYGGSWVSPFYEADSWTYSYYVPQNIGRVIELMGGPDSFVERLDYAYTHKHIDYSNEPGFLTVHCFNEAGRPDLSSRWAHNLMNKKFTLKGYPDNDDTGSMGSWYAFSALGLFPNAGQDFYYLTAPKFKRAEIKLSNGRRLLITANASIDNVVIKSCSFNGVEIFGGDGGSAKITHSELMKGGKLEFQLCHSER